MSAPVQPINLENLSAASFTAIPVRKVSADDGKVYYLSAFGGVAQNGPYNPNLRKFANPAPLGLCAFALTTFVLSLINAQARHVTIPNIVFGLAYGYGGLIQLLSGMWEMAAGNTFGATALSSYGGFWISFAIIETAEGFGIISAYTDESTLDSALGFYFIGWAIFSFILVVLTLRSTYAFFSLFFSIFLVFLLLAIGKFVASDGHDATGINKAAGVVGCIAAFLAWWNAVAGVADKQNSFFTIPVCHFPWSAKPEKEDAKKEP